MKLFPDRIIIEDEDGEWIIMACDFDTPYMSIGTIDENHRCLRVSLGLNKIKDYFISQIESIPQFSQNVKVGSMPTDRKSLLEGWQGSGKRGAREAREDILLFGPEARDFLLKHYSGSARYNNLIRFLQDESQHKIFAPLFKKYKLPIFAIWNSGLTLNPSLRDLDFDKYLDAQQVFQEICGFIATELTEKMVESPMTDREKVESHGFDKKHSFRPKINV